MELTNFVGMIYFIVSKVLSFMTNPLFWLSSLLLIALIRERWRKKAILTATLLTLVLGNTYFTNFFIHNWESGQYIPLSELEKYNTFVILGGFNTWNDYTMAQDCNEAGDRLFGLLPLMQDSQRRFIVSGGSGRLLPEAMREAEITKIYLDGFDHLMAQVLYENQSRNTMENLKFSALLVDSFQMDTPCVISSAMHIRRVKKILDRQDLYWKAYGVESAMNMSPGVFDFLIPRASNLHKWQQILHEWIGYIAT